MNNRTLLTIITFLSISGLVAVSLLLVRLKQSNQPEVFQQGGQYACETTFTLSSLTVCGQSPCTSNTDCGTNLVCTSNGYCSMPAYVETCSANPSTSTCCQAPATPTPTPSPTPYGATPTPTPTPTPYSTPTPTPSPTPYGATPTPTPSPTPYGATPTPTPNPILGSIGDYVWNDKDKDGIQDNDEVGIPNVTVKLLDSNENVIRTTTTDNNGYYLFNNLPAGTYKVEFVKPSGYDYTPTNQGSDDSKDSDVYAATNRTDWIYLALGEIDLTWDAGYNQPVATPTPPSAPELPKAGGLPPTLLFTLGGIVLVALGLLF